MEYLFCKIAQKEISAHIVFENQDILGFVDNRPIRPGHTQIIPKRHFETFDITPLHIATQLMLAGQEIGRALKSIHKVKRVGFVCTGGDVLHTHAHIVPMFASTDITSRAYIFADNIEFRPAPLAGHEDLRHMAENIRHQLS